jgi:transposase InsO family protein
MSRSGDCFDNAVMEAFFSRVKIELDDRFETGAEAKRSLFEHLEVFYNQESDERRRQPQEARRSRLGTSRQVESSPAEGGPQ